MRNIQKCFEILMEICKIERKMTRNEIKISSINCFCLESTSNIELFHSSYILFRIIFISVVTHHIDVQTREEFGNIHLHKHQIHIFSIIEERSKEYCWYYLIYNMILI